MRRRLRALTADVTTDVTESKSVDWDELRALHVKGISLKDLADKYGIGYGALRARSSREKWGNNVTAARNACVQVATDDLQASVRSWIGKIDTFAHKTLDSLCARDPDALKISDLQVVVQTVKSLADVFRPNAGLDREQASGRPTLALQVNVNGQTTPEVRYTSLQLDPEAS